MMKLMGNSPYNFIMSRFSRQERARAFAEERLKESEIKYRRLFTHMSEGFAVHELIYDSGQNAIFYKILTINSAYKKIINIPEEKIQGPWQLNFMVSHLPPI